MSGLSWNSEGGTSSSRTTEGSGGGEEDETVFSVSLATFRAPPLTGTSSALEAEFTEDGATVTDDEEVGIDWL